MKDEKVVDQSTRWPRVHKQKETNKIGKIISRIIQKIGKILKQPEKLRNMRCLI